MLIEGADFVLRCMVLRNLCALGPFRVALLVKLLGVLTYLFSSHPPSRLELCQFRRGRGFPFSGQRRGGWKVTFLETGRLRKGF